MRGKPSNFERIESLHSHTRQATKFMTTLVPLAILIIQLRAHGGVFSCKLRRRFGEWK